MKAHTIILGVCLIISVGCLGSGYMMNGFWMVIPILSAMAIFWAITKKKSAFWSASGLLMIYVVLAGIGVLINLSIYLMIVGCTSALVCWDLMHFRDGVVDIPSKESLILLERDRLQSLAAAVVTSLMLTLISLQINLQFQFGAIVLIVFLAVGCLTYGAQYVLRKH